MTTFMAIMFRPLSEEERTRVRCEDSGSDGELATVVALGHLAPTPLCPQHAGEWAYEYCDPDSEYWGEFTAEQREATVRSGYDFVSTEYLVENVPAA